MNFAVLGAATSLTALLLAGNISLAQGKVDFGRAEYETNCASCHGVAGRGDGVLRSQWVKTPSDLTTLSKRNGGVLPTQRAWDTIDGRTSIEIAPHGSRAMPLWGPVYRAEETQPYDLHTRNRMASLIDYLVRIQES